MAYCLIFLLIFLTAHVKSDQQVYHHSNAISQTHHFLSGTPHVSPYTVAIIKNNDWYRRCAGTLISDSLILTAAQCAECNFSEVILGAYDIFAPERTQIREYITEEDVIFHPYYDPRTLDNDIALIKLPNPVRLTHLLSIAKLPEEGVHLGHGSTAYLTGWEKRHVGYSNILTQSEISIFSKDRCVTFWPAARINDKKFCGSNIKKEGQPPHLSSQCIIDPGSPLTLHGNPDTIVGFVSGQARCGSLLPEIFINVSSYRKWINEVLKGVVEESLYH